MGLEREVATLNGHTSRWLKDEAEVSIFISFFSLIDQLPRVFSLSKGSPRFIMAGVHPLIAQLLLHGHLTVRKSMN